ncbi:hypothetical protein [Actinacidiphila sp. bgisy160]|uniref:hypothetical protein n=1 Tax=Actinacidiphila sp. bgisy160 TaxID=3413796 RepID=UPI003D71E004
MPPTPQKTPDAAAAARRARFGKLPERIRPDQMIQESQATAPDPARNVYAADEWLVRYCL